MRVYADTSWWIACKITSDVNHELAIRVFDLWPEIEIVWTPWQRVEVFNSLRQLERADLILAGVAHESIRLLEREIRLGYWSHVEFDWRNAIRTACGISAKHGLDIPIRGMDLFHVAIAIETEVGAFVTFDREQEALADAAGLHILRPRR
ncbi:type II toxin-antitoxin system VapC family toxin [Chthoniobacter flavus]|uniref:type II toxin-antitoxin system VapC family toxin n=1 Tax=Chthoniobacter flavus TaxID=191863 RepID=UPI0005B2697A|nr:PIN domain-containing protein [Chthoniobacter flavus]